jgi:hypothetical protein
VSPVLLEPRAIEELKREARSRAEGLGHHLQAFRSAKNDPVCHVAFCRDCHQMVAVSLEEDEPRFYGYALEAACSGSAVGSSVPAGTS